MSDLLKRSSKIENINKLMKELGIHSYDELRKNGYDVDEYLERTRNRRRKNKHIYNIEELMKKTGASSHDDLRKLGYDVDEYFERKNNESEEEEDSSFTYRNYSSDDGPEGLYYDECYIGT